MRKSMSTTKPLSPLAARGRAGVLGLLVTVAMLNGMGTQSGEQR